MDDVGRVQAVDGLQVVMTTDERCERRLDSARVAGCEAELLR
jgi:hypothetical protein